MKAWAMSEPALNPTRIRGAIPLGSEGVKPAGLPGGHYFWNGWGRRTGGGSRIKSDLRSGAEP